MSSSRGRSIDWLVELVSVIVNKVEKTFLFPRVSLSASSLCGSGSNQGQRFQEATKYESLIFCNAVEKNKQICNVSLRWLSLRLPSWWLHEKHIQVLLTGISLTDWMSGSVVCPSILSLGSVLAARSNLKDGEQQLVTKLLFLVGCSLRWSDVLRQRVKWGVGYMDSSLVWSETRIHHHPGQLNSRLHFHWTEIGFNSMWSKDKMPPAIEWNQWDLLCKVPALLESVGLLSEKLA